MRNKVKGFKAGCLAQHLDKWENITTDKEVLSTVSGLPIEFQSPPELLSRPNRFAKAEQEIITSEIEKLLARGVIKKSQHEKDEIISPIFLRAKADGSHRLILNLKKTNEHIENIHFKMETISTILKLIRPNCYMASVDIKDAYYSVHVDESDQKYLKFIFNGQLYQFTCLPNGLCSGPRKFTKLLKPPLATLREAGHILGAYIDDIFNMGMTSKECQNNVLETVHLLNSLGFNIHPDKSKFTPSQVLVFLGFVINSVSMKVSLTAERKGKIKEACANLLNNEPHTIRIVAKVIGLMTASFPGVKFGRLHFRDLERCKSEAVKGNKGCYDSFMYLNEAAKQDVQWWLKNIDSADNDIYHENPSLSLTTDASKSGWGATHNSLRTGGTLSYEESLEHINVLELIAVLFGLQSLIKQSNIHVKVLCDNTTAVHTINNMGTSHSLACDKVVKQIWQFAISKSLWISATHLPGRLNKDADEESRKNELRLEWKLNETVFREIQHAFERAPEIDLFASRLNYQLKPFVSYRPDPECFAVNAFLIPWGQFFFYAFPPFSLIPRILQKVYFDQAEGILVVPKWPNQAWYSLLMKMLVNEPIILPPRKHLLYLPSQPKVLHPLHQHLQLLICHISGKN